MVYAGRGLRSFATIARMRSPLHATCWLGRVDIGEDKHRAKELIPNRHQRSKRGVDALISRLTAWNRSVALIIALPLKA